MRTVFLRINVDRAALRLLYFCAIYDKSTTTDDATVTVVERRATIPRFVLRAIVIFLLLIRVSSARLIRAAPAVPCP